MVSLTNYDIQSDVSDRRQYKALRSVHTYKPFASSRTKYAPVRREYSPFRSSVISKYTNTQIFKKERDTFQ